MNDLPRAQKFETKQTTKEKCLQESFAPTMLCRLFELGVKLQAARAFSVVTEGPQLSFCFMQGLPEVRCRKTK